MSTLATTADVADEWMEVVSGVLIPKEGASFEHGSTHCRLTVLWARKPHHEQWLVAMSPGIEFERHEIYLPDVAGWRKDRPDWDELVSQSRQIVCTVRPDWVCEILSPTTAVRDLEIKYRTYERCRVPNYWIVDPMKKTLRVFRWTEPGYTEILSVERNARVRAEPFEATEISVGLFFGDEDEE